MTHNTTKHISIILSVIVSFLFVALIAYAATIVGTNISTDGTLTVSGNATTTGSLSAGQLAVGSAYWFPAADGSADQILKTDGSGNLTWQIDAEAAWEQIWSGAIAPTTTNTGIYITASSTVDTLRVTDLTVSDAAFDADTLYIDSTNNRVGIGTTTPNNTIQVSDLINFDNAGKNTFLGYQAGYSDTTAENIVFLGYDAGYSNTTAEKNVFVGCEAGYSNTTAEKNSLFGYQAGFGVSTGDENLLIGYQAGDNLTTGSNNIVIGYDIDAPAADSDNILNIGNLIFGTGIDGTGTNISSGGIGIGTTTPTVQLQVTNSSSNTTTTVEFGKANQNKGTCLKMYNEAGTLVYCIVAGTTFSCNTTSCE